MKESNFLKFDFRENHLYLILLFSFLIIACYHLSSGFYMSSDSHRFSRWADDLIRLNFNLYDFFSIEKASHRPPLFFFSLPVILISLCKVIFGNEWQFAFLLLNLVFLLFSLIFLVKCLLLIGVKPILISLTLPLIIISVDVLTWPRYILSDMSYAFLVVMTTYFITKGIINDKINYFEIFSIIFLLLVSRPSSIPVIFAICFFIIISKFQIFLRQKNILFFLLIIFIFTPFILSLTYLLIDTNFADIAKVDFLTDMVKVGMIIHDRPNTWVDVPNNIIDVIFIYFIRFISFFNPYASTFSILHIILNVFQIVLILLSIFIWSFIGESIKKQDRIFFFIIILSFSVAAFHSFILIDYDWRYRFPIILPLIMLFPISLEIFLNKINQD